MPNTDICPSRDDAQPHIFKAGRCTLCDTPTRWTCPECGRRNLVDVEFRTKFIHQTLSEPAMAVPACIHCTPDEDPNDPDRRDWDAERERREDLGRA